MSDPFRLSSNPLNPLTGRPGKSGEPGLMGELQSEVPVEAAPLLIFVVRHIRAIVGLVLLFVASIIGYGIWQWQGENSLRDSQMELGRVLERTGQARVEGLEALLPKLPGSMRLGVLLTLAESALAEKDLDRAAKAYRQISSADPDGVLGYMAGLDLSGVLQRQGKFDEAVALLEGLASRAPDALKLFAREDLASAAEQAGQIDKALATYEELASTPAANRSAMERNFFRDKLKELQALAAKKAS